MSRRRASWKPAPRYSWLRLVVKPKPPKTDRKPVRIPRWRRYRHLPHYEAAS